MNIDDILKAKRDAILQTAAQHGAYNVRIFGSVARGEARADSDVDFLVELERGRDLIDHIALIQDLEDLLHLKVDVVTERGLHAIIRNQILKEAVPL